MGPRLWWYYLWGCTPTPSARLQSLQWPWELSSHRTTFMHLGPDSENVLKPNTAILNLKHSESFLAWRILFIFSNLEIQQLSTLYVEEIQKCLRQEKTHYKNVLAPNTTLVISQEKWIAWSLKQQKFQLRTNCVKADVVHNSEEH